MGSRLQLLIIVAIILAISVIINMIKKEKLELKYALMWIIAAVGVFVLTIIPQGIGCIANILDIASPMNALFFVGLCFVLLILFSLTVAQSRNSKKIKILAQQLGLMEYEKKKVEAKKIEGEEKNV